MNEWTLLLLIDVAGAGIVVVGVNYYWYQHFRRLETLNRGLADEVRRTNDLAREMQAQRDAFTREPMRMAEAIPAEQRRITDDDLRRITRTRMAEAVGYRPIVVDSGRSTPIGIATTSARQGQTVRVAMAPSFASAVRNVEQEFRVVLGLDPHPTTSPPLPRRIITRLDKTVEHDRMSSDET